MSASLKVIVEQHSDGYVAYPIGVKGVIVGQGATYEEALSDVRSAIQFHIETFGNNSILTARTPKCRRDEVESTSDPSFGIS